MNDEAPRERASIIMLSDVVCPWCYVGLMELEKLQENFPIDVHWSPFLLDPTVPPEGRPQTPYNKPGDPPTPVEERAERLGIHFTRGRTFRPNSHLALEAAMYASEAGIDDKPLHRALYKAHFDDLEDVSDVDVLVRIGAENGLNADELREVLETRRYQEAVDDAIGWAQSIGVTAVPTFIIDERHGVVGAQEYEVLERVMLQLGYEKHPPVAADA
ncbi:MAG: DsbA family oxidoreductase [Dehalococcoidia bacterium]